MRNIDSAAARMIAKRFRMAVSVMDYSPTGVESDKHVHIPEHRGHGVGRTELTEKTEKDLGEVGDFFI
jgi:hypothetical protein